jgi:hypothetical protein
LHASEGDIRLRLDCFALMTGGVEETKQALVVTDFISPLNGKKFTWNLRVWWVAGGRGPVHADVGALRLPAEKPWYC